MIDRRPPAPDIFIGIVASLLAGITVVPFTGFLVLIITGIVGLMLDIASFVIVLSILSAVTSFITFAVLWRNY